ncbi:YbfB/YjiJ family MFS transporter [Candidatus Pantoea deserta]|uniref:YbfB/YjiJ family MFS transporter n=1 Tax=Candidatus Pantoea deserta TaxID=1869313 RepID=A0A3N4PJF4_9GAMM|nr:YbfB/YjiJ family MFS transporter [Pantoea deserta]RPD99733.1 YbfB/YjiJ family MFS transporter [Pantoea deserta]
MTTPLFAGQAHRAPGAVTTMLTGIITLVAVMGIGRFSLTPQIPLMIHDGHLSLSSAGLLAAMNYIGYLLGAIHVSRMRRHHARYLKAGLVATVLVTLLSAIAANFFLQCLFRFIAGVGGAWALIIVTSWTQLTLAAYQAPKLSAAVFTGPGVGITLTGALAWLMSACGFHAAQAWGVYGLVAAAAALMVFNRLPKTLPFSDRPVAATPLNGRLKALLAAYTLAGFGYILPATFLSQMARSFFHAGNMAALFWPLFGLAAVAGVLLVMAFASRFNTRSALATAMVVQGAGVASVVLLPDVKGLLIATLLTGLGFLSIMQLTMRLAREISAEAAARTVAVLTAGYATGQLTGPLVSSASVLLSGTLQPALILAAAGLVLGGLWVRLRV